MGGLFLQGARFHKSGEDFESYLSRNRATYLFTFTHGMGMACKYSVFGVFEDFPLAARSVLRYRAFWWSLPEMRVQ